MNDKLIDLRNEIIECFTCDEEIMSEEGVLERRIDEILMEREMWIHIDKGFIDVYSDLDSFFEHIDIVMEYHNPTIWIDIVERYCTNKRYFSTIGTGVDYVRVGLKNFKFTIKLSSDRKYLYIEKDTGSAILTWNTIDSVQKLDGILFGSHV